MLTIPLTATTTGTYSAATTFVRNEKYTRGFVQFGTQGQTGFLQLYVWPLGTAYGPQPLPEIPFVNGKFAFHYASVTVPDGGLPLAGVAVRTSAPTLLLQFSGAFYTEAETYGEGSETAAIDKSKITG